VKVETSRFGTLEIDPQDRIFFPEGMMGLPDMQNFILFDHPGGIFQWLQCCDDPDLAFVVMDPSFVVGEHKLRLSDGELKTLGVADLSGEDDGAEIGVLATVNVSDPRNPTVNLLAPLCIAMRTRKGLQVVQHHSGYSTRHELRPGGGSRERRRKARAASQAA
jgi:flagellar assembly factor FliW